MELVLDSADELARKAAAGAGGPVDKIDISDAIRADRKQVAAALDEFAVWLDAQGAYARPAALSVRAFAAALRVAL